MSLAVLLAAALWQESPTAPPAAAAPPVANIAWVRRPLPEFPERAMQARVQEGAVRVRCIVRPAGRFADCQVIDETPARVGFGPAALSAMRSARFEPATTRLQPGDAFETTLRFQAPPRSLRR